MLCSNRKIFVPRVLFKGPASAMEIAIPKEKTLKNMNTNYQSTRQRNINVIPFNTAIKVSNLYDTFRHKSSGDIIFDEILEDCKIRSDQLNSNSSVAQRALRA